MAANYWDSSQFKYWKLDRTSLQKNKLEDLQYAEAADIFRIEIYFANLMHKLGKRLQLRQQVTATALVYFKRFYAKNSFRVIDPYLVASTCMYLACKIEESPHHIRTIVHETKNMLLEPREAIPFPYDHHVLAECEFYLLEDLQFHLIIFHPYRSLSIYMADLKLGRSCLQTAWFIVNDSYRTNLCLLYPPHMIALAAIYLMCSLYPEHVEKRDMRQWFADLQVEIEQIVEITQELITLYEFWSDFKEDKVPAIINKLRTSPPLPSLSQSQSQSQSQAQSRSLNQRKK
ncbi:cyclin C [Basidiobolus meristosporus CBS 931.73]|uniref:Cyclin C n=1 Tax=Basidiobolus meristosporus CBS 931.73 TaxID=1314790 RepID=A0A1Y1XTU2_9FUNG|nr:cyclin C [Basidiobolus meristosporus CBS 931.73]|eukprot:ORX89158.1 cyclin C [Basidiobolus meristosporus CBS 931.73]